MTMPHLKPALRLAREDLNDLIRARRAGEQVQLDEREQRILADLQRDGYAVVEGYWDRDRAFALRDSLEQRLEGGEDVDYPEGAYLRFWDNRAYDEGVRRLYHVDRLYPELAELRNDPMVRRITTAYYGMPFHSGVLVFQHNTRSNENTRYYHVDAFEKEFKSFLYLDDVTKGNGPFTYLRGTHKGMAARRFLKYARWNGEGSPTGFAPEELGDLLDTEVQIEGAAGTLILADVRGFHRGSPQLDDDRSVIVNYMFKHEGDRFMDK
jgi:ectoine hydroxylase-related dioxygenase (phytanoyl-CoA dioxygenase family)